MGMGLACFIVVSANYAIIKELLTKIGGGKNASGGVKDVSRYGS